MLWNGGRLRMGRHEAAGLGWPPGRSVGPVSVIALGRVPVLPSLVTGLLWRAERPSGVRWMAECHYFCWGSISVPFGQRGCVA